MTIAVVSRRAVRGVRPQGRCQLNIDRRQLVCVTVTAFYPSEDLTRLNKNAGQSKKTEMSSGQGSQWLTGGPTIVVFRLL